MAFSKSVNVILKFPLFYTLYPSNSSFLLRIKKIDFAFVHHSSIGIPSPFPSSLRDWLILRKASSSKRSSSVSSYACCTLTFSNIRFSHSYHAKLPLPNADPLIIKKAINSDSALIVYSCSIPNFICVMLVLIISYIYIISISWASRPFLTLVSPLFPLLHRAIC